ncbi:hypothetical protein ACFVAJ_07265 [Agromyces sp. NPDC057679]|uniref:hypothetical protein n=1 Tax=Agromyces sp. NPDC057679 TaxID=3346207 RepID=UPI00366B4EC4
MTDPAPPRYGVRLPSAESGDGHPTAPEPAGRDAVGEHVAAPETPEAPEAPVAPPRRRRWGSIVAISLLGVALAGAVAGCVWFFLQLEAAQDRISEQEQELEQQRELIDEKETFGEAMNALLESTARFDSTLTASVVPWDDYRRLAVQAWAHRWDADAVASDTRAVEQAAADLDARWNEAQKEAGSNASGSGYEAVIDRLSGGFVSSVIDDAKTLCADGDDDGDHGDLLACVFHDDPYLVHFDAAANAVPYMNDELRTGIAYHEFAHVLQITNPSATRDALEAFDGDDEVMADCYALTFLDGWKLDHRIWTSDYEYWDVNIGYGTACTGAQQQVIRDWHAKLGVELQAVSSKAL